MCDCRTSLYPLGFLSAIAFGARFIIQWIESEKAQQSVVPRSFWQLSLLGNLLLMIHSFIQVQYPICLVQTGNALISWRNLELMQRSPPLVSFRGMIFIFIGSMIFISFAFAIQNAFLTADSHWLRVPKAPWQTSSSSVPLVWHLLGTIAYLLFSSRFWIQWWMIEKRRIEKRQTCTLPPAFWWMSCIGALLSMAYFLRMQDSVNLIGPLVGFVPYVRNLMLIRKRQTMEEKR